MPFAPQPEDEVTFWAFGWWPWLSLAIQAVCVVHILYNRNGLWWVLIVLFFPFIGGLIYFFVEIVPELRTGGLRAVIRSLKTQAGRIREARNLLEESDTVDNRVALVQELKQAGRCEEALEVLEPCLHQGVSMDDAYVLMELADLRFLRGQPADAKETCLKVLKKCPKDVIQRATTLLARSHEALGEDHEAEVLYKDILPESSGEEVRLRYAELLARKDRAEEARALITQIFKNWKGSPALYKKHEREWHHAAKRVAKSLEGGKG